MVNSPIYNFYAPILIAVSPGCLIGSGAANQLAILPITETSFQAVSVDEETD
jgi:hypothetical protein